MSRIEVRYLLTLGAGERAEEKAERIAFEQTLEMAPGVVESELELAIAGQVGAIEQIDDHRAVATVSYPEDLASDISQLLNLLFGNVSLYAGVRVQGVLWPEGLLERLHGPRHGMAGLRELCGVHQVRPMLCAVSKPVGRSASELATLCGELAEGGVDVVKDDHSLADQPSAPFHDRVQRCSDAVREVDGDTLYFPGVTGTPAQLAFRCEEVAASGCRGVVLCPFAVGLGAVRELAQSTDLAIIAHPAMSGMFFHEQSGIAPELLLGELLPMIGCDAVIFPHAPGKFSLTPEACQKICLRARESRGGSRPAMPAPGGSLAIESLPDWMSIYGPDSMFIVGSGLQTGPDIRAQAAAMMGLLEDSFAID